MPEREDPNEQAAKLRNSIRSIEQAWEYVAAGMNALESWGELENDLEPTRIPGKTANLVFNPQDWWQINVHLGENRG